MSDQTIQITMSCRLASLDLPKLADFLTHEVQAFFGDEATFSGNHQWGDKVKRQKNFTDVEAWSTPSADPLDHVHATINSKDYLRSFRLTWYRTPLNEVDLSATITETEQDDVLILFEKFEDLFKAPGSPRTEAAGSADVRKDFRLERKYFLPSNPADQWLQNTVETISRLRKERRKPTADLRFRSGLSRNFDSTERLIESLNADPNAVQRARINFSFSESDVSISCNLDQQEFGVDVDAASEQEATHLMTEIDGVLGLKRNEGGAKVGLTKRGFGKSKFEPAWFKESIRHLRTEFPRILYFMGEVTLIEGDQSPRKFYDIDEWFRAVETNWGKINRTYASIDGPQQVARVTYFHREEAVTIQVDAASQEDAEALLERLNKQFQIEFSEEDPYSKANSSGTFAIRAWQDRTFAELFKDAADVAIGPKRWTPYAWIREEGDMSQPVQHAKSVEEFVTLLQSGKKYVEADVRVAGPRGRLIRIHVYENRSRIAFRSTLPQKELDYVLESFRTSLKLKTLKEIESQEPPETAKPKERSTVKSVLAVLGTSVVALVLSVAFIKALVAQNSVTVITPRAPTEFGEIKDPKSRVVWQVKREQYFRTVDVPPPRGNIRVIKGQDAQDHLDKASGEMPLNLDPGVYVVTVSIPSLNVSDTVRFTVPMPPPPDIPASTPTPGRRGGR